MNGEGNPQLRLAGDFLRDTDCHLFLTGRAGTGKTTFLHHIKKKNPKRMVVTAPTGVAAINAGGVTLHSFFQLPFGPILPGGEALGRQKFNRDKINLIKCLDLLVIDEISMVRADLLDGVDTVLRRLRRNAQPFGGVQLLLIGDLQQLAPVAKEEEWRLLRDVYETPYFFSSKALGGTELVVVELQHIYRQSDRRFIELLNQVRDNRLDAASLAELNRRYDKDFVDEGLGYIHLCTHNARAETINAARLAGLPQRLHRFAAEIEGDFPEFAFPTSASLELKVEAQVMFVRNDPSPEKRFFNGKIGKVTGIVGKTVIVRCPGDDEEIEVEPATWENIEYALDEASQEIREKKVGAFTQHPLKAAWAITIHKSQGLTFDRAIVDAEAAFAFGQVYVALSRCRSLEGLVLSTPLAPRAIKTDPLVRRFIDRTKDGAPDEVTLHHARVRYQQRLLLECFAFEKLQRLLVRLVDFSERHASLVHLHGGGDLRQQLRQISDEVATVGANFRRQLQGLFPATELPAGDPVVAERLVKAAAYFRDKLEGGIGTVVATLQAETDNKELRKQAKDLLKGLREETAAKLAAIAICGGEFSAAAYLRAISAATLESGGRRDKQPLYAETDVGHPELFKKLQEWRGKIATKANLPAYQIMHHKTLVQIAVHLPENLGELKKIKGIGSRTAEKYGDALVALVGDFRQAQGITTVTLPPAAREEKAGGKKEKVATRLITLRLFEEGLSVEEIAERRNVAVSTIESHLAECVAVGEAEIERLLAPQRLKELADLVVPHADKFLGELKRELGEAAGWGELKLFLAYRKWQGAKNESV
jgi:hypothetical protein